MLTDSYDHIYTPHENKCILNCCIHANVLVIVTLHQSSEEVNASASPPRSSHLCMCVSLCWCVSPFTSCSSCPRSPNRSSAVVCSRSRAHASHIGFAPYYCTSIHLTIRPINRNNNKNSSSSRRSTYIRCSKPFVRSKQVFGNTKSSPLHRRLYIG